VSTRRSPKSVPDRFVSKKVYALVFPTRKTISPRERLFARHYMLWSFFSTHSLLNRQEQEENFRCGRLKYKLTFTGVFAACAVVD
jgi:hypothetical protein